MPQNDDTHYLGRAVELAREAMLAGDAPFGSVLVNTAGDIIHEDRNRTVTGEHGDGKADATLHPEFTIARWAQKNLGPEERAACTVYTSGEHCPMCAAAHAYCGLGPIAYAASSSLYAAWQEEHGFVGHAVAALPINQVAPNIKVRGPYEALSDEVKKIHVERWEKQKADKAGSKQT
ncbi:hypothetical protein N3K66_007740 [Trichothecium roseum]|uniref:Uncharacterized protein n=1 Tax=Trichothecium roseum TaxID=47278 RepID=A0ACC0UWK7_9HYPO|nr:hypothetical protein N3K66_007740 [Trichothecium roseum]